MFCGEMNLSKLAKTLLRLYFQHHMNTLLKNVKCEKCETDIALDFRVNVSSTDEVFQWIESFQTQSNTTYNKSYSDRNGAGKKTIISGKRHCHHQMNIKDVKETMT